MGRAVRPGIDPQWLPTDRDLALAWQRNKAAVCPGCGTRHDEWDPAQGGDRQAYMADVNHCPGCATLAGAEVPTGPDGQPLPGHRPFLVPAALWDHLHPLPDK
jgi:hypothetical protein